MLIALLISRFLLSGIFLLAGFSKWMDRPGSAKSLIDFGLPKSLAAAAAVLLPVVEVVVGILLLPAPLAVYGHIGALSLLVIFILGIGVALARGRKPDCHCFGQLHSKPVGPELLIRNIALAAIPSVALYYGEPQPGVSMWFQGLTPGENLLLVLAGCCIVLLGFLSWLCFQLVQQGGRVLGRLDALEKQLGAGLGTQPAPAAIVPAQPEVPPQGVPVGQPAPAFELQALDGPNVSLAHLLEEGKPLVLLFTHPSCGPCTELMPEVAQWQGEQAAHFRLALISRGEAKENRSKMKGQKIHTVLLQKEMEASADYQAYGTPSAVLVRPNGTIGSSVAGGAEAIRTLISNTINESLAGAVPTSVREGDLVPPMVYPDLDGNMVSLGALRGTPTVLLFWHPGCGYCDQMLPDVQNWEKHTSKGGTKLLVISAGSVEDNRKLSLRSKIVLDQTFSAGRIFGAGGTPSGLLLDVDGRVVSKVAVGRPEILEAIFSDRAVASV